jgi:hypothetical protein
LQQQLILLLPSLPDSLLSAWSHHRLTPFSFLFPLSHLLWRLPRPQFPSA